MSRGDAATLLDGVTGERPVRLRDRALLELLYGCGLRASEVVGLRHESLDLAAQVLVCRGKRDRQRLVPLGGAAESIVTN